MWRSWRPLLNRRTRTGPRLSRSTLTTRCTSATSVTRWLSWLGRSAVMTWIHWSWARATTRSGWTWPLTALTSGSYGGPGRLPFQRRGDHVYPSADQGHPGTVGRGEGAGRQLAGHHPVRRRETGARLY